MTPDPFSSLEPAWIGASGPGDGHDHITQLSSVRLRRNIDGFPFPAKSGKSEFYDSAAEALGALGRSSAWDEYDFRLIDNMNELSRFLLLEMRVISRRFVSGGAGRFLIRDGGGTMTCMVNEEDHISISSTNPGLDIFSSLESVSGLEKSLTVKMVKDTVLGYLTSNPAYAGTGMTASVMFHLPGLDETGDIARVADTFKRDWNNLELSRLLSHENESCGSFYILCNRVTLSVTPEEIARNVTKAAEALISREMYARHKIQSARESDIGDRLWRAWGLLRHAKKLTFPEAVDAFSFVKLGSDIGILPGMDDSEWRRLIIGAQRYHLSLQSPVIIDKSEEPRSRAVMFRQYIERLSSSAH